MRRTLSYYWRMNLAVAAGSAVAAAVLTGALLVGDSMRGSLRALTLERLGRIEYALTGQRFLPQEVVKRLAASPEFAEHFETAVPAILLQGNAQHARSKARASEVALSGVDERFLNFFPDADGSPPRIFADVGPTIFPPAVINEGLRRELGAEVGDAILVSFTRWSEVPRGSLLGRKDTGSVVQTLRLTLSGVVPDRGLGRFRLKAIQSLPYNVFVPLEALQKALDQEGAVNSILVTGSTSQDPEATVEALDRQLLEGLALDELGILVVRHGAYFSIESREYILKPSLVAAIEAVAEASGAQLIPIMTYLANRIGIGERGVPYSTVSALDPPSQAAFGALLLVDRSPAPAPEDDEILLNAWAAQELAAEVGERVELTYFTIGPREELSETTSSFRLRGIVALEGLGADPTLTQEYPGIAGSDNMAEWDPPFPLDLGEIRPADEEYWDRWRGTPKAFVAEATGRRLWKNRWGELTAVRVAAPAGGELEPLLEEFRAGIRAAVDLSAFGLRFKAVRSLGLAASKGSSDFGGLFIGMSMFIIASAALLAALLFSLGVEQRVGEIGLRLAVGEPPAKVRRRLLIEGGLLAAVGSLVGLVGAVGYGGLMMAGLRSWWRPTVGTSELYLHVTATSLLIGYLASVAVVLFAIVWTVVRIGRIPTPRLLARVAESPATRSGSLARWIMLVSFALAGAALVYALAAGETANPTLFGLIGPALLIGSLALFARRIAGGSAGSLRAPGLAALFRMAAVNAGRNRGRSVLSATLVACACFLIVTVAAYHQNFADKDLGIDSGAGGYALVAESAIPLHHDLNDADGRFELGLPDTLSDRLAGTRIVPMRLLPGDDASCLNLYVPGRPRILGVPREQIERGGFRFQQTVTEVENPWTLLEQEANRSEAEEVIPAIGDIASTQWILKLKLDDDLVVENEYGEPIRLRLVANLKGTVFQSELLISEENFLRHFPSQTGYPYFLVSTPPGAAAEVSQALESGLGSYGFDAVTTAEKLASFIAVQNTYLATFRTIGGLGLLLGTVGLAIVLARNVIERRRELAMLRAFGFRRTLLSWMIVIENGLLLLAGLVIGALAALVTAGPHLLEEAAHVPWSAIGVTLVGIYLFGIAACSVAAFAALRVSLLPSLKAD